LPLSVLAGPSFAKEVAMNLPTAITVSSNTPQFRAYLSELFHQQRFRVYTSTDVLGVEVGGAVKNVLAIAAGINDGLGFGMNARAALITRGMLEMMRLGEALGCQRDTFMGLTGLGDLMLTCNDDQSRNRRYGLLRGKGITHEAALNTIQQTIEGISTSAMVYQLSQRLQIDMPICRQVYRILYEDLYAKQAVEELMQREPKNEIL
jgi:glycerol-3-phosphate dehydrogenase (NAD(P)+)